MNPIVKKVLWGIAFVVGAVSLIYADVYLWRLLSIGTGIEAKILASGVFVSGREPNGVINEDLHKVVNFIRLEVDQVNMTASATAFGVLKRTAIYRQGLGCTLLSGKTEEELRSQVPLEMIRQAKKKTPRPWPDGDVLSDEPLPPEADEKQLRDALERAFAESGTGKPKNTRAVVVVYDGRIVAERYAFGFSERTPLLGYGMSQIIINALAGILAGQGGLNIDSPADVPEWREQTDLRRSITADHLLRMTSGLKFDDTRPPLTDTVVMLGQADMAAYAASKELIHEPGSTWMFSNGTTNILSRLIRDKIEEKGGNYFMFPRAALFDRIGMNGTVIEPDAAGTFVGSTYTYAPARDWARLGLLYLNDGVWAGERLLPEGWVDYSTEPTVQSPGGIYGAHVWLHPDGTDAVKNGRASSLPGDAFFALGHNGQSLTIIPSRKLVVVRLGMTKDRSAFDLEAFITDILSAIGKR